MRRRPTVLRGHMRSRRHRPPELQEYFHLNNPAIVLALLLRSATSTTALSIRALRRAIQETAGYRLPMSSVRYLARRWTFTAPIVNRPVLDMDDVTQRVVFCTRLRQRGVETLRRVIWSDEKIFVRRLDGQTVLYSPYETDVRAFREDEGRNAERVHVFLALHPVSGKYFITKLPYGPDGSVDTLYYGGVLTAVSQWIRTIPGHENLIWQQDGAPAHTGRDLADLLAHLPVAEVWSRPFRMGPYVHTGNGWPSHSPDLSVAEWPWAFSQEHLNSVAVALREHNLLEAADYGSLIYASLRHVLTKENMMLHLATSCLNIALTLRHNGSNRFTVHGWRRQYGTM